MADRMGTFRIDIELENPAQRGPRRRVDGVLVERWTGEARVHVAGTVTPDEVVFGEPGDLIILGSRTLDGLNVMVDPVGKRLVDSGPAPAAAA